MNEMIERVAAALYSRQPAVKAMYPPIPIPWEQASEVWKEPFRSFAKAAIEAMRDPTEAMLRACPVVGTGPNEKGDWAVNTRPAEVMWPAMIDAALK